jgi:hypothetical protein
VNEWWTHRAQFAHPRVLLLLLSCSSLCVPSVYEYKLRGEPFPAHLLPFIGGPRMNEVQPTIRAVQSEPPEGPQDDDTPMIDRAVSDQTGTPGYYRRLYEELGKAEMSPCSGSCRFPTPCRRCHRSTASAVVDSRTTDRSPPVRSSALVDPRLMLPLTPTDVQSPFDVPRTPSDHRPILRSPGSFAGVPLTPTTSNGSSKSFCPYGRESISNGLLPPGSAPRPERTVTIPYRMARTDSTASSLFIDEKIDILRDYPSLVHPIPTASSKAVVSSSSVVPNSRTIIPPCSGDCPGASGCRRCVGNRASGQNREPEPDEDADMLSSSDRTTDPPMLATFGLHDYDRIRGRRPRRPYDARHGQLRSWVDRIVRLSDHTQILLGADGWFVLTESTLALAGEKIVTRLASSPCWSGIPARVLQSSRQVFADNLVDRAEVTPDQWAWEKASYHLNDDSQMTEKTVQLWYDTYRYARFLLGVNVKHPLLDHSDHIVEDHHDSEIASEIWNRHYPGLYNRLPIAPKKAEAFVVQAASPPGHPVVVLPVFGVRTTVAITAGSEIVDFGGVVVSQPKYIEPLDPCCQPIDVAHVRQVKGAGLVIDATPFRDMYRYQSSTGGRSVNVADYRPTMKHWTEEQLSRFNLAPIGYLIPLSLSPGDANCELVYIQREIGVHSSKYAYEIPVFVAIRDLAAGEPLVYKSNELCGPGVDVDGFPMLTDSSRRDEPEENSKSTPDPAEVHAPPVRRASSINAGAAPPPHVAASSSSPPAASSSRSFPAADLHLSKHRTVSEPRTAAEEEDLSPRLLLPADANGPAVYEYPEPCDTRAWRRLADAWAQSEKLLRVLATTTRAQVLEDGEFTQADLDQLDRSRFIRVPVPVPTLNHSALLRVPVPPLAPFLTVNTRRTRSSTKKRTLPPPPGSPPSVPAPAPAADGVRPPADLALDAATADDSSSSTDQAPVPESIAVGPLSVNDQPTAASIRRRCDEQHHRQMKNLTDFLEESSSRPEMKRFPYCSQTVDDSSSVRAESVFYSDMSQLHPSLLSVYAHMDSSRHWILPYSGFLMPTKLFKEFSQRFELATGVDVHGLDYVDPSTERLVGVTLVGDLRRYAPNVNDLHRLPKEKLASAHYVQLTVDEQQVIKVQKAAQKWIARVDRREEGGGAAKDPLKVDVSSSLVRYWSELAVRCGVELITSYNGGGDAVPRSRLFFAAPKANSFCDRCYGKSFTLANPIVLCEDRFCPLGRHRECFVPPPSATDILTMDHRCATHQRGDSSGASAGGQAVVRSTSTSRPRDENEFTMIPPDEAEIEGHLPSSLRKEVFLSSRMTLGGFRACWVRLVDELQYHRGSYRFDNNPNRMRYELQRRALHRYSLYLSTHGPQSAWQTEMSSQTSAGVDYSDARDNLLEVRPSLAFLGLMGAFTKEDREPGAKLADYPCMIMRRAVYEGAPFSITTAAAAPGLTIAGEQYVLVGQPTAPAAQINNGSTTNRYGAAGSTPSSVTRANVQVNAKFAYCRTAIKAPGRSSIASAGPARRRERTAIASSSSSSSVTPAAAFLSPGIVYRDYISVVALRPIKANDEIFLDYGPDWRTSECFTCDYCLLKCDDEAEAETEAKSVKPAAAAGSSSSSRRSSTARSRSARDRSPIRGGSASEKILRARGLLWKCQGRGCRRGYHEECYRRQFDEQMTDTVLCAYHAAEARTIPQQNIVESDSSNMQLLP